MESPDIFINTYPRYKNQAVLFVGNERGDGILYCPNDYLHTHADQYRELMKNGFGIHSRLKTLGNWQGGDVPDFKKSGAILPRAEMANRDGVAEMSPATYISSWTTAAEVLRPLISQLLKLIGAREPFIHDRAEGDEIGDNFFSPQPW